VCVCTFGFGAVPSSGCPRLSDLEVDSGGACVRPRDIYNHYFIGNSFIFSQ
jgi:hypothetical protein